MIEAFIEKFGSATRKELDDLVMEKLSAVLSEKQKKVKVNNLISSLRKEGRIENERFRHKIQMGTEEKLELIRVKIRGRKWECLQIG